MQIQKQAYINLRLFIKATLAIIQILLKATIYKKLLMKKIEKLNS